MFVVENDGKIASSHVRERFGEVPPPFCFFGEGGGSKNLDPKLPPPKK